MGKYLGYIKKVLIIGLVLSLVASNLSAFSNAKFTAFASDTENDVSKDRLIQSDDHSLILKANGDLYVLGSNDSGQLGIPEPAATDKPILLAGGVIDAACGPKYTLFVKNDYTLWAVGLNDKGQLGTGDFENRKTPVMVMKDILRVKAGVRHSLALKTNGFLYAFGDNGFGQLGDGTKVSKNEPVFVMRSVRNISAGAFHSLAITFDNNLYTFGNNSFGQLANGRKYSSSTPEKIAGNVTRAEAMHTYTLVLNTNGDLNLGGNADFVELKKDAADNYRGIKNIRKGIKDIVKIGLQSYAIIDNDNKKFESLVSDTGAAYVNDFRSKYVELIDYMKTRTPDTGKLIAFTFDDGPSFHTIRLLDALKEYDSKATFFMLGSHALNSGSVIRRMKDEGHEIANHSYNHPDFTSLSRTQIFSELDSTDEAIKKWTGEGTSLFRPPYGAYNGAVLDALKARGKAAVLWNVDTKDWANLNAAYVKNYILNHSEAGDIVLLHDSHSTSVDGFIAALPHLKEMGFTLVTVPELLEAKGIGINAGSKIFSGNR